MNREIYGASIFLEQRLCFLSSQPVRVFKHAGEFLAFCVCSHVLAPHTSIVHKARSGDGSYSRPPDGLQASLYQYDRIIYMDADSFPIGSLDNLLSSWP